MTTPVDDSRNLPASPSLRHLQLQAKDLLRDKKADSLTDAQFKIARLYGFPSWVKLKTHVKAVTLAQGVSPTGSDEMRIELNAAIGRGDFDRIVQLVQAGAAINVRGEFGVCAIGCVSGDHALDIIGYLLDHGADPNLPGYHGHSPVGLYAYEGKADAVRLLLAHGANPNQTREETGETPLHLAIAKSNLPGSGRLACVTALLERGADPNIVTKSDVWSDCFYGVMLHNESPLHWAAAYSEQPIIEALIAHGARRDLKDGHGDMPVNHAGRHWRPAEIMSLLNPQ